MNRMFSFLLLCAWAGSAAAEDFRVAWPVACDYGKDCYIQNYVDVDADASKAVDYTCSRLTYEGHKGTDIRVGNLAGLKRDVAVLAAAPGIVKGLRDGMEDRSMRALPEAVIKNRECGNGVVIAHESGWETQYCHLRKGSVRVKKGDAVTAGQPLGLMGLSGQTEFPHVHFAVRRGNTVVDPFIGPPRGEAYAGCHVERHPIWTRDALEKISYIPTAVLASGFASEPVTTEKARDGEFDRKQFGDDIPLLVFWVDVMGILPDDVIELEVKAPSGETLVNHRQKYAKGKAQIFHFIGRKREEEGWEKGVYTASFRLKRKKGDLHELSLYHTDKVEIR